MFQIEADASRKVFLLKFAVQRSGQPAEPQEKSEQQHTQHHGRPKHRALQELGDEGDLGGHSYEDARFRSFAVVWETHTL